MKKKIEKGDLFIDNWERICLILSITKERYADYKDLKTNTIYYKVDCGFEYYSWKYLAKESLLSRLVLGL